MSRLRAFTAWVSRIIPADPGGAWQLLSLAAAGIVMSIVGLYHFFPDEALRRRVELELERNLPVQVEIDRASLAFPLSLEASGIRLTPTAPNIPPIAFDTVAISPTLSSLWGQFGAGIRAEGDDGVINGSISGDGAVTLDVNDYRFARPIQGFSSLTLGGTISTARLASHLQPAPETPSSLTLTLTDLVLSGTDSLGLSVRQVNLGTLSAQADGTGQDIRITRASLSGGDITASATGQFLIGASVGTTRLNLEVVLQPTASLDPSARSFLELVGSPGPAGGRKFTVRGNLAHPAIR